MESFRFSQKRNKKISNYAIGIIAGMVLSILIFRNTDIGINKPLMYLIISVVSLISILSAAKKAAKEFEEIIIEGSQVKFYFLNKMKDMLKLDRSDVLAKVDGEKVEFLYKSTGLSIGSSNKEKMEESERWDNLLAHFDVN